MTETNLFFQATGVAFHKEPDFHDYLVISCNYFFSRSCRVHDSSKTEVSIAEFKGAVSGRKKTTCFNLVSLLIRTTFSCEILNSLKNEIKKIV